MARYRVSVRAVATAPAGMLGVSPSGAFTARRVVRARCASAAACRMASPYVNSGLAVDWTVRPSGFGRWTRRWCGRFVPADGGDGQSGVREPRRPSPTGDSGRVALDPVSAPTWRVDAHRASAARVEPVVERASPRGRTVPAGRRRGRCLLLRAAPDGLDAVIVFALGTERHAALKLPATSGELRMRAEFRARRLGSSPRGASHAARSAGAGPRCPAVAQRQPWP